MSINGPNAMIDFAASVAKRSCAIQKVIEESFKTRFLKAPENEDGLERLVYFSKPIERFVFAYDVNLSIQAGASFHSTPRKDVECFLNVEVGYPNFLFSKDFIERYAPDPDRPLETIYSYVPLDRLCDEIATEILRREQEKATKNLRGAKAEKHIYDVLQWRQTVNLI